MLLAVACSLLAAPAVGDDDAWPDARQCAAQMTVPPGFQVKRFAAEPDVVNPIALDFDHRGRLYVLEALQYPRKAPPGQTGRDRICILEDTDGDHEADRVTLFADGLNLASGLAVGHGGVFVGQAPYLLFLEDTDGDDHADRRTVLLDGWAYEDTHETLNSFLWGPDGWLYGSHGIMHESHVRGRRFNAAIWRYHPQTRKFEVFAEGTNNPWGLDYDENGSLLLSTSVIPHLYHVVPGGFHKHGKVRWWTNPYAYGEIETIVDHRHFPPEKELPAVSTGRPPGGAPQAVLNPSSFGGGHAHAGCLVYQGGSFPPEYHGRVLLSNLHGNRINSDLLRRNRSSYTASHGADFLLANDPRFRAIQLRSGPDGSIYVLDWYDTQICHNSEPSVWDRRYGRIYKIVYQGTRPRPVGDLSALSTAQLVELLRDENCWWWRRALLILDERGDRSAVGQLKQMVRRSPDDRHSLRALWALFVLEALDEPFARQTLSHPNSWVRTWAVRLLGETSGQRLAPETWSRLLDLARSDPSPDVRLQLACSCVRWPAGRDPTELLKALIQRDQDAQDPAVPAMIWVALEPGVLDWPAETLNWLLANAERHPIARDFILPWTLRRLVESGEAGHVPLAVATLGRLQSDRSIAAALGGLLDGLQGRRLEAPPCWRAVSARLLESADADVRSRARRLGVHFGDPAAAAAFETRARDQALPDAQRIEALQALALARRPASVDTLLSVALGENAVPVRRQAIRALENFQTDKVPGVLLPGWPGLPPALRREVIGLLVGRRSWASALVEAVERGLLQPADLTQPDVRQIMRLNDAQLNERLQRAWGKLRVRTPEAVSQSLSRLRERLAKFPGDRTAGRAVFEKHCMVCHRLYGEGFDVGPDLTGANRRDPEYLLVSIVDPNRIVGRAYYTATVIDEAGRVHTGLLVEQSAQRITLKGQNEKLTVLPRDQIDQMQVAEKSLMPEGLPENMTEQQFSDLVAYLMEDLDVSQGLVSTLLRAEQPLDAPLAVETAARPLEVSAARWRPFRIGPAARIELDRLSTDRYRRPPEGCRYVYAEVEASQEVQTTMIVGFQKGLKVWVNGRLVLRQERPASVTRIAVRLHQGRNRLLLKVSNIARRPSGPSASGASWLKVRLVDPQQHLRLIPLSTKKGSERFDELF